MLDIAGRQEVQIEAPRLRVAEFTGVFEEIKKTVKKRKAIKEHRASA